MFKEKSAKCQKKYLYKNLNYLKTLVSGDLEIVETLRMYDKVRDIYVTPHDVGFGISQIIGVLVAPNQAKHILIEQPELHLHPALQSKLGDYFIDRAGDEYADMNNMFLIETHSEHILLRIMRRIRETTNNTLPRESFKPLFTLRDVPSPEIEDFPIHSFSKDNIAVLYVDRDEDRSIVKEIPLNENGELMKAWPGGFFEEGMEDIFS